MSRYDDWKTTDPDPRPDIHGREDLTESEPAPRCVVCGAELFAFYGTWSFGGAYCLGHTEQEKAEALRVTRRKTA